MGSAQRFSVVIVNYNGGALLAEALDSVLAAGVAPGAIYVIDNGSGDDSLERALRRLPGCAISRNGCNAGFARAVNQGLRRVRTEFALLLNNDAQLEKGAFEALAQAFDDQGRAALLGGRLLHADGRRQRSVAALPTLASEWLPRPLRRWSAGAAQVRAAERAEGGAPLPVPSVIGALLAVRMAAVAEFGLLDEAYFFFLEETEWCARAARHGWRVLHVPGARARHLQGATARRYAAGARIEYQRSKLVYFRKDGARDDARVATLLWLKAAASALAGALAVLLSLGLAPGARARAAVRAQVWWWFARGRPPGAGLPGKCPPGEQRREAGLPR